MTLKSFIAVGTVALGTLGIASAKSYDFTLTSTTKAGDVQLKAGSYKVKLEGAQAVFTNQESNKSVTVPVKVEHAGQKFSQTALQIHSENGVDSIRQINLGGSDTEVELGE